MTRPTGPLGLVALIALAACQAPTTAGPKVSDGHDVLLAPAGPMVGDALPSAEPVAFQRVEARLGYAEARIDFEASTCAAQSATGPGDAPCSEPPLDEAGRRICPR